MSDRTMPEFAISLDHMHGRRALELVRIFGDRVLWWKVHMLVDGEEGSSLLRELKLAGARRILLDAKLHDIPSTVHGRALAILNSGHVDAITVHVGDDVSGVESAVSAGMKVFAVTVLTSQDPAKFEKQNGRTIQNAVRIRTLAARDAGVFGIVSPPRDLQIVKSVCHGFGTVLLVPGTRLPGSDTHDQNAVMTPGEAARAGGDIIVLGRELTQDRDPSAVFDRVLANIHAALYGA